MNPGDLLLVAGDLARFVRYSESGRTITVIFDGEEGESVVSVRHCQTRNLVAIQEAKRLLAMAESEERLETQLFLARKAHETLEVFADQPILPEMRPQTDEEKKDSDEFFAKQFGGMEETHERIAKYDKTKEMAELRKLLKGTKMTDPMILILALCAFTALWLWPHVMKGEQ